MEKCKDLMALAVEVVAQAANINTRFIEFNEKFEKDFILLKENSINLLKLFDENEKFNTRRLSRSNITVSEIQSTTKDTVETSCVKNKNLTKVKSMQLIEGIDLQVLDRMLEENFDVDCEDKVSNCEGGLNEINENMDLKNISGHAAIFSKSSIDFKETFNLKDCTIVLNRAEVENCKNLISFGNILEF